jgi:hypothetical protein
MEEWVRFALQETSLTMDNVSIQAKGISAPSQRSKAAEFLFTLWHDGGRVREFRVLLTDYLERFPDFRELIEGSKREGLCEAWPSAECEIDRWNLPAKDAQLKEFYNIRLTPPGLLCMKEIAKELTPVHRQATIDGEKVDLRSGVALMIATAEIANLADTARLWVACVKNGQGDRGRSKPRINLERVIGWRGHELAAYDPELKAEIMTLLASPCSFLRRRRGRESGKGESEREVR